MKGTEQLLFSFIVPSTFCSTDNIVELQKSVTQGGFQSALLDFPSPPPDPQDAINCRESFCLRTAWPSFRTRLARSVGFWPTWWTTWRSSSSRQRRAVWARQTLLRPSLCSTTCRNQLQAFAGFISLILTDNPKCSIYSEDKAACLFWQWNFKRAVIFFRWKVAQSFLKAFSGKNW